MKGVGHKAVESILEVRAEGGPFRSLYDFCERVALQLVNRSTIEALIKAGAFDSVHGEAQRAAMVEALEGAIRSGQRAASDRESGQASLFGGGEVEATQEAPEPRLPRAAPWSTREQLKHEKAALGFFATRHPLDEHGEHISSFSNARIADVKSLPADTEVIIGAMIASRRTVRARRGRNAGQRIAMLALEDFSGRIEAVAFADVYQQNAELLGEDEIHFFRAKVDRRREEPCLILDGLIALDEAPVKLTKTVRIVLFADRLTDQGAGDAQTAQAVRKQGQGPQGPAQHREAQGQRLSRRGRVRGPSPGARRSHSAQRSAHSHSSRV